MQGEFGFPRYCAYRTGETDVGSVYGRRDTPDPADAGGLPAGSRCLLLGTPTATGSWEADQRKAGRIAAARRADPTGLMSRHDGSMTASRSVPCARTGDFGIVLGHALDAVNWTNLPRVWAGRADCVTPGRGRSACVTRRTLSQGRNLYFIFIARLGGIEEYLELQAGILDANPEIWGQR